MRRLRYTEEAIESLTDIADYIAQSSGSATIGREFTLRIRGRCVDLAALPGTLGRDRSELGPSLRSVVFRGYVIFFRYENEILRVVAILEGHRDIDAIFHDSDI